MTAPDVLYIPQLTNVEAQIMTVLYERAGRVVSMNELSMAVYGYPNYGRALNTHVRRIRVKLGRDAVMTVRGRGFIAGKARCCPECKGTGWSVE